MKLLSELLESVSRSGAMPMKREPDVIIPASKPRNPTYTVLANKKNAAGPMADKKQAMKNGDVKHKGKVFEAKRQQYQVRIESEGGVTGDWQDIELGAASLQDIADSINAHPMDAEAINKFGLHELTSIVEDWIGSGANSRGSDRGSWDDMDFDVKSLKDDVLKISWTFSGVDMSRLEKGPKGRMYGTPVSRSGVITIMPGTGTVSESVAGPFEKFSKNDRVKVKKTGQEVTVVSQNEIGLVFTRADDAVAVGNKTTVQSKGYKEYMPRELEKLS